MRVESGEVSSKKASSGELAAQVVQDVRRLVDLEVMLAKQELKDLAVRNGIAAACAAAAGLLALIAVLVAAPVLVVVAVPWHWEAALVWMVAYLLVAGALALFAKARFRLRLPAKTFESLKENKEWALRHLRSTGR